MRKSNGIKQGSVRWHDGYIYEKDYKKYMKDQKNR